MELDEIKKNVWQTPEVFDLDVKENTRKHLSNTPESYFSGPAGS